MNEPSGRLPSARGIARYRADLETLGRADDILVRQILGVLLGAGVGLLMGVVLVPLTLLHFINPITALVLVFSMIAAGCIAGWRRARRAEHVIRSDTRWELQQADHEYDREINAVRRGAAAMKASGVEQPRYSDWAFSSVAQAFHRALSRVEPALGSGGSPELPPAPLPSVYPTEAGPEYSGKGHGGSGGAIRDVRDGIADIVNRPSFPAPPEELVEAKRAGKLVPFVGAGISLGSDVSGNFPTWGDLPRRLLDEVKPHRWHDAHDRRTLRGRFLEVDPADPTREVARTKPLADMLLELDTVKHKLDRDYANALSAIFRPHDAAPGAAHRAIMALQASFVLTTNYDQLLEATEGPPTRQVYTWKQADRAHADVKLGRRVLFKVHGSAEAEDSVVLTDSEYKRAHADPAYRLVVHYLLAGNTFLFVGYGMSDPSDLDIILAENAGALKGGSLHFALLHISQAGVVRRDALLREHNIAVIPFNDFAEVVPFLEALARA